jgi:hypothetical protein
MPPPLAMSPRPGTSRDPAGHRAAAPEYAPGRPSERRLLLRHQPSELRGNHIRAWCRRLLDSPCTPLTDTGDYKTRTTL